jgi:hypothetical protein
MKPREIAEELLGHIEWQSPESGLCLCPGEAKHQHGTGLRDCRVRLDGVATIHCFHRSCVEEVTKANRELRRRLWNARWRLVLPGGGSVEGLTSCRGEIPVERRTPEDADERLGYWERRLEEILERYRWPVEQMISDSPAQLEAEDGLRQFGRWLGLFEETDVVWIGDVYDSGKEVNRRNFRSVTMWRRSGEIPGNFTCGSTFKPGTFTRNNECVVERKYLVVESDELRKEEVGGVFRFMREELRYPLAAVVDTGGKSLHAWFRAPASVEREQALKICLTGLKCDPRMFGGSQPARVPGARREGKVQRLLFCI